jgi:hypothetical protein
VVFYTVTFERTGDLVVLMGLSGTETTSQYVIQRPVEAAAEELASDSGVVVTRTTSTPTGNDEVFPSRTLMIHDSFGDVLAPLLRPYFSELTTVTGPWVTSLDVPEALLQAALQVHR